MANKDEAHQALVTAYDYIHSAREQLQDAANLVGEPEGGPCRLIAANLGVPLLQVDGLLELFERQPTKTEG